MVHGIMVAAATDIQVATYLHAELYSSILFYIYIQQHSCTYKLALNYFECCGVITIMFLLGIHTTQL